MLNSYVVVGSFLFFLLIEQEIEAMIGNRKMSFGTCSIIHTITTLSLTGVTAYEYFYMNWYDVEFLAFMASISTGYYVLDWINLLMSKDWKTNEKIAFSLHHALALTMAFLVSESYLECEMITFAMLSSEVSSLFSNINAMLTYYAKHRPYLRLVNGIFMMITHFVVRFVAIPMAYYYESECVHSTLSNIILYYIIVIPFTILNAYWFVLMVRGLKSFIKKKDF